MQSWMGSDFTNDDLVRQSSIVEDYTHAIIGEEELSETDRSYIKFGDAFEKEFLSQGKTEIRSIEDTLKLYSVFY